MPRDCWPRKARGSACRSRTRCGPARSSNNSSTNASPEFVDNSDLGRKKRTHAYIHVSGRCAPHFGNADRRRTENCRAEPSADTAVRADCTDSRRRPRAAAALTADDVNAWLDGYMPYALHTGDIAGAVVAVVKDGQILTERGLRLLRCREAHAGRSEADPVPAGIGVEAASPGPRSCSWSSRARSISMPM